MQRGAAETGIAREFKDIFELGGVPAFNQFYNFGIFVWKWLYRGYYEPWHLIDAPTIANPRARRQLYRMNVAKAICAELASLVWGEECEINVSMDGRESTDENPDQGDDAAEALSVFQIGIFVERLTKQLVSLLFQKICHVVIPFFIDVIFIIP